MQMLRRSHPGARRCGRTPGARTGGSTWRRPSRRPSRRRLRRPQRRRRHGEHSCSSFLPKEAGTENIRKHAVIPITVKLTVHALAVNCALPLLCSAKKRLVPALRALLGPRRRRRWPRTPWTPRSSRPRCARAPCARPRPLSRRTTRPRSRCSSRTGRPCSAPRSRETEFPE